MCGTKNRHRYFTQYSKCHKISILKSISMEIIRKDRFCIASKRHFNSISRSVPKILSFKFLEALAKRTHTSKYAANFSKPLFSTFHHFQYPDMKIFNIFITKTSNMRKRKWNNKIDLYNRGLLLIRAYSLYLIDKLTSNGYVHIFI